jgi:glycosyltransferase involved in cell wall biosynthesis
MNDVPETVHRFDRDRPMPAVTVGISLHNYGRFILEALDSVLAQTLAGVELVVVDDASTDDGADRCLRWMQRHAGRFARAALVHRRANQGLAATRNRALDEATAPLFFVLDADNTIYPRCLERLAAALQAAPEAAFAYPVLEVFGAERRLMGTALWNRERLAQGNYIDAMSLVRAACLREMGGYARMPVTGWEDYDLWCRFAERGWFGVRVPEILARYRVHQSSMLNTITRTRERTGALIADMIARHPWLTITPERH